MTAKRFTINTLDGSIDLRDDNKVMTYKEVVDLLNELHEERNYFERKKCEYWNKFNLAHLDNIQLRQENEQLKQRNDRQAKQLDRLYHLIEEKDWRTLMDILDDFKRCEEQLQREWRTYE